MTPYLRQSFLSAVVHMPYFFATSLSGMLKCSRSSASRSAVNICTFVPLKLPVFALLYAPRSESTGTLLVLCAPGDSDMILKLETCFSTLS